MTDGHRLMRSRVSLCGFYGSFYTLTLLMLVRLSRETTTRSSVSRCETRPTRLRDDVTVTTVTRHTRPCKRRQDPACARGGLFVPLPYPATTPSPPLPFFEMPPPFLSHRPQPLRADCHLCSEKYSPFVLFFPPSGCVIHSSYSDSCHGGVSPTLSCQRPPK